MSFKHYYDMQGMKTLYGNTNGFENNQTLTSTLSIKNNPIKVKMEGFDTIKQKYSGILVKSFLEKSRERQEIIITDNYMDNDESQKAVKEKEELGFTSE